MRGVSRSPQTILEALAMSGLLLIKFETEAVAVLVCPYHFRAPCFPIVGDSDGIVLQSKTQLLIIINKIVRLNVIKVNPYNKACPHVYLCYGYLRKLNHNHTNKG